MNRKQGRCVPRQSQHTPARKAFPAPIATGRYHMQFTHYLPSAKKSQLRRAILPKKAIFADQNTRGDVTPCKTHNRSDRNRGHRLCYVPQDNTFLGFVTSKNA
jgi:hypothetical protein